MDLHKELNRLQSEILTEEIKGAKAYGIVQADRCLVAAFMKGANKTVPLKFEHPGLVTTAARSDGTLLIQNDLGTTAAHVLVVRVTETSAVVTHTDIHLQRLRFFQSLLAMRQVSSGKGSVRTRHRQFLEAICSTSRAGDLEHKKPRRLRVSWST